MSKIIALNEIRILLRSPFAWISAALLQLIFSWLFLAAVEQFTAQQTIAASITPANTIKQGISAYLVVHFLAPASLIMMLATPLFCMNAIAGERQSGRFALLASSPVTSAQIIIGKFAGITAFQYIILALNLLLISTLLFATPLDLGHLLSAFLGLALFVATATALCLLFSSLTTRPVLAAFLGFSSLLLLWLAAVSSTSGSSISPSAHMYSFMQGFLDTRDIAYFIAAIGILLVMSVGRLNLLTSTPLSLGSLK